MQFKNDEVIAKMIYLNFRTSYYALSVLLVNKSYIKNPYPPLHFFTGKPFIRIKFYNPGNRSRHYKISMQEKDNSKFYFTSLKNNNIIPFVLFRRLL